MLDQIVVVALVVVTFTFLTRCHPRPVTQPVAEELVTALGEPVVEVVKGGDDVTGDDVWMESLGVCTDYDLYTVRQLRKQITQMGAKIPHNATKANLIKVLKSL